MSNWENPSPYEFEGMIGKLGPCFFDCRIISRYIPSYHLQEDFERETSGTFGREELSDVLRINFL